MSGLDSPKPFYYEDLEEGFSLFVDGSPEWFWSFEAMESYVSDLHVPYQLILVDLGNWQSLLDSGAFDA